MSRRELGLEGLDPCLEGAIRGDMARRAVGLCAPEFRHPGEAARGPHAGSPTPVGAGAVLPQLLDRFPCLPGGEVTGQARARTCSRVHAQNPRPPHARARARTHARVRTDPSPTHAAGAQPPSRGDLLLLLISGRPELHIAVLRGPPGGD